MGLQLTRSGLMRQQPLSEPAWRAAVRDSSSCPSGSCTGREKLPPAGHGLTGPSPTTEHGHAPSHAHLAIPVPTSGPCCPRRTDNTCQGRRCRSSRECRAPYRGQVGGQHRQSWPGPRGTWPCLVTWAAAVPALGRAAARPGMTIGAALAQGPKRALPDSSSSSLGQLRARG